MHNIKHTIKLICTSITLVAVTSSVAVAGVITRGYYSSENLAVGTVVSLKQQGSNEVEKASTDSESLIVGVVTEDTSNLVDIQPQGSNVRVAAEGGVSLLATTANGDIQSGDKLIISPVAGVVARDNPLFKNTKILGIATSDLSAASSNVKQVSVEQQDGSKTTISIGKIAAKLVISERPQALNDKSSNALSRIAEEITGKPVSLSKVIASIVILLITLVIIGAMLNSSISGTFRSLGRNPLSREGLLVALVRVILIAVVILFAGMTAAYTLLVL